jgi:protocatechuate 3,4-dioxygenase beta subunit
MPARAGRFFLNATIGDYLAKGEAFVSDEGKIITKPDIKLQSACLVLGEVTDSKTCLPIGGAKVCVYGAWGAETTSSDDGTFKLRVLPVGGLQLFISKGGYVTRRIEFSAEGQDTVGWRVLLKPGGIVRGRVVDQDGRPVAGICVQITEDGMYSRSVKTDQDGRYEMRDVDPDITAEMRLSDQRISMSETKHFDFPKGSLETTGDFTANLEGKVLRTITGKLTDANGLPVAGADVQYGRSNCQWNAKKTKTDANGSYTLSGLTPERDMLTVQADGFAPMFVPVDTTGDASLNAKLETAHTAEVQIVDPTGKPLPRVSVTVCARTPVLGRLYSYGITDGDVYRWLYTTTSDENGKVSLKNLPDDGTLLQVYKGNYIAPMYTSIRVDSTDNVIQMQGAPQVAGTVVDADTGSPIRCFTVKWRQPGSYRFGGDEYTNFNRSDGKFLIQVGDNRSPNVTNFEVKVLANGYVGEKKTLPATSVPVADYSNIYKLRKTFSSKGKVVDSKGKGIPDAKITIVETGGYHEFMVPPQVAATAYHQKTSSRPDGSFTIDPVFEKTATVIVEKDGYPQRVFRDIDITKPLKLTLPIPAVVEIRAKTIAPTDGKVTFTSKKASYTQSGPIEKLSEGGVGIYRNIEPGKYLVWVSGKQLSFMCPVTLKSGERLVLDLDKPGPVSVSGRVTRLGEPVSGAKVRVGNYGDYSACITDAEGRYALTTNKTGPTVLTCYQAWPHEQTLKLKTGENTANLTVPSGTLSGHLIDAETGNPIASQNIHLYGNFHESGESESYSSAHVRYSGQSAVAGATTGEDGSFTFNNVPAGELTIAVGEYCRRWDYVGSPFKMEENSKIDGLTAKMGKAGVLDVSVVDSKSGKPVERTIIGLMTPGGFMVEWGSPLYSPKNVPAGKYRIWIEPFDSRHYRTYSDIEVMPGKTAKVKIKVPEAKQRILFKTPKGSKFAELNWKIGFFGATREENTAWIGYKISDAVTGKPILESPFGPEWGGYIERRKMGDDLAIPVKPGTYNLEAVLRNTRDKSVSSKANLWHIKTKVTVKPGKDTVIKVK